MLSYQHGLCMKNRCTFNVSIKFFNKFKTSDEEQSGESNRWETTNTWRKRLYIEEALKKQDTNYLCESFFLVKLFVNFCKDTKLSKHLVYLERKD